MPTFTPSTYKVVFAFNTDDLAKQVDELLAKGWILQGGVAIAAFPQDQLVKSQFVFSQALIRH